MVHMRIVVPAYQSEHVLDLLEHTPSACNVIFLERAARKPQGDVILCDVAREDASVIVSDLRELDVDTEGSIAIEHIDSAISAAAARGRAGGRRACPATRSSGRRSSRGPRRTSSSTAIFLAFMALACLIAAVGIFLDSPILIVGAMIVGPEFGPLAGLCVALVQRRPDVARRSLRALAVGFPVGITAAFLFALAIRGDRPRRRTGFVAAEHPLTDFISHPDAFSFIVAYFAGVAGVLSLTSAKSGALIGVLVSVTTIPAAANIGVAAAYGEWAEWRGAMLQLALNLFAIVLAGVGTLFIQRRLYMRRRRDHLHDEARETAGLPLGRSRRVGSATYKAPPAPE